jgi:hypothetical protein
LYVSCSSPDGTVEEVHLQPAPAKINTDIIDKIAGKIKVFIIL